MRVSQLGYPSCSAAAAAAVVSDGIVSRVSRSFRCPIFISPFLRLCPVGEKVSRKINDFKPRSLAAPACRFRA